MCSLHFCMDNASLITSDSVEILLENFATTFQCECIIIIPQEVRCLSSYTSVNVYLGLLAIFFLEETTLTARHREPLLFQDLAA